MRRLLALLMLAVLALSGAAPACAQPTPHHGIAHHAPMPGHGERDVASHDCIGCGIALPDPPRLDAIEMMAIALPPTARAPTPLIGTQPQQPLRPPRLLA
ncbi:hypothetical protein FHS31_003282 [Sphingomonas vulcanisoli]|uniref:DUF2946 domain-containing protein n=1 Tax=Sphingomonas vulcanisoli TaxID=1658060 RepID=A0ABX0TZ51_9SPHN|nr:hypothetical protein [Sphingomonas vulcanisoli]NIJ09645.1 hypothetical protein [Sphingomonas vulcanisoli]